MCRNLLFVPLLIILPACGNPKQELPEAPESTRSTEKAYWPDWRGPTADGQSKATGLPLNWSETQNILWKTAIHDLGYSTPVIWGSKIWLTTATKNGDSLFAIGIDLASGEVLHDIELFKPKHRQMNHALNSFATPSAVVEEGRVYVHFGVYGTACLDSNTGETLWVRNDLKCNHFQGPVSSPVLYDDLLILTFMGYDVQFVIALDKNSGETVWRKERPKEIYSNLATGSLPQSYETPVILEVEGKAQLIHNSSKVATGLDPRTGEEIWRYVYTADNAVSRIVAGHGLFFVGHGAVRGQAVLAAVRQGGSGDITETHVVWKNEDDMPLLSSPVLVDDLLYSVSVYAILVCLEAKTGKEVWRERFSGMFGPSLLHADNRIYLCNKRGETIVFAPGRTYRELAVNKLDGSFSASPVVAGDTLLLRSETHLYRVKGTP